MTIPQWVAAVADSMPWGAALATVVYVLGKLAEAYVNSDLAAQRYFGRQTPETQDRLLELKHGFREPSSPPAPDDPRAVE